MPAMPWISTSGVPSRRHPSFCATSTSFMTRTPRVLSESRTAPSGSTASRAGMIAIEKPRECQAAIGRSTPETEGGATDPRSLRFRVTPFSRRPLLRGRCPRMVLQVHARLDDGHALAFEKLFLHRSVGLADENLAALSYNTVPGNAFARGRRGHGASGTARSSTQLHSPRQRTVR